jgi:hypothetical protein
MMRVPDPPSPPPANAGTSLPARPELVPTDSTDDPALEPSPILVATERQAPSATPSMYLLRTDTPEERARPHVSLASWALLAVIAFVILLAIANQV